MKFALLGAAALAATTLVTPVKAQEVITNPGKCAQYYPNANCQHWSAGQSYGRRLPRVRERSGRLAKWLRLYGTSALAPPVHHHWR